MIARDYGTIRSRVIRVMAVRMPIEAADKVNHINTLVRIALPGASARLLLNGSASIGITDGTCVMSADARRNIPLRLFEKFHISFRCNS